MDVFLSALSALGTVTSKLHGVEKNVVDDVVLEIVRKTPPHKKIDSEELKNILDGLNVDKIHIPGYKKVKIRYEVE